MITTKRLVLRRASMEDLTDLHEVFSHEKAMRYWDSTPFTDPIQTQGILTGMIAASSEDSDDFIVEYEGRAIGKAGCWRVPEIGIILHPDYWGKGMAFEALSATIPHAFDAFSAEQLVADVDPRNAASLKLLARLGFVETGRAEKTIKVGHVWCDSVYLALSRQVWLSS